MLRRAKQQRSIPWWRCATNSDVNPYHRNSPHNRFAHQGHNHARLNRSILSKSASERLRAGSNPSTRNEVVYGNLTNCKIGLGFTTFQPKCQFQKMMGMKGVKSGFFHRSGCEYLQEWMRMVSEYTEEDANSF